MSPVVPIPVGGAATPLPCLHLDALVPMADGSVKRAGELRAGDLVMGENGQADPVVLVRCFDLEKVNKHIRFKTQKSVGTTMSHRHGVFAGDCTDREWKSWRVKRVMDLEVGECVPTVDGGVDEVIHIEKVQVKGQTSPIANSGIISADGVVVSCYTLKGQNETQQSLHASFQPARNLYNWADKVYSVFSEEGYAWGALDRLIKGLGLERHYYIE